MLGRTTHKSDWKTPDHTPGNMAEVLEIPEQGGEEEELIELHMTVKSEGKRELDGQEILPL